MRLLSFLLCISIVATALSCQRASKDDVSLIPSADESSPNGLSTLPAEPHSIADETKSTSQVARSATTDATPKAIDSTRGDVVFSLLTSQVWSNRPSDQKHPFGMCPVGEGDSEFRFMADGTYEHRWIPLAGGETVVRAKGRWNLQLGHDKMWIACLDNGERHVVTLMEGGSIRLDGFKYPSSKLDTPAAKSLHELPAISLPAEVEQRNSILSSRVWHRANDIDLDRFPATIEFRSDFTYLAHSAAGRAYPIGTWYATADKVFAVGQPDAQGESYNLKSYGAYLPVVISNADQLVIGNTPYVPHESISGKGTIHHFGGHGPPIRVQVEYAMPIRQGIPCRFDVHFISAPDMTLQRFSVTKQYDHGYRKPDGTIAQVDELAAIDLKNVTLKAGESKSFSVDVVFPQAGDHSYYLNAMIKGTSQHWDEREAVCFRIQDVATVVP